MIYVDKTYLEPLRTTDDKKFIERMSTYNSKNKTNKLFRENEG